MIRKHIFFLGVILLLSMPAFAESDIEQHRSCAQCGMDRKAYAFSRMLIEYEDGETVGLCSLHCAVREISRSPNRPVAKLFAADRSSRNLVDAAKAVWVIGGSKRGVMTRVPKWAFGIHADAEEFVKSYGGKTATWEDAMTAAKEEIAKSGN